VPRADAAAPRIPFADLNRPPSGTSLNDRISAGEDTLMKRVLQSMIVGCASLAMFGCMALKPLSSDPTTLRTTLKRGDQVEVVTTSGKEMQLTVDSLDDSGLQASGQRLAYSDIRSISRKQVNVGTTTMLVLGVVAAGALAAAAGGGGGGGGY
jgi:hypothetical protein